MPGTANPCINRQITMLESESDSPIIIVGIAIKAMDATMIFLRPTASDNIPINGDMMAMAITVAPTVMPTWVSVAENACIIIGKIA